MSSTSGAGADLHVQRGATVGLPGMSVNERIVRDVLASIPLGVCILDATGRITYWNLEAERLSGHRAEDVAGRRCCETVVFQIEGFGRTACISQDCSSSCPLLHREGIESNVIIRHSSGHQVRSTTRSIPILDEDGRLMASVLVFDNGGDRLARTLEIERLKNLALLDSLTRIGNRRYGERLLAATLAENARHDRPFGALFADVDGFKSVNDKFGHCTGDQVLRDVARTLAEGVRLYDVVCRWGGDEFLLVFRNVTPEQLGERAEALRRAVRDSSGACNGNRFMVTISLGATMSLPVDDEQTLVGRADWLMYCSKAAGGNRVTFG